MSSTFYSKVSRSADYDRDNRVFLPLANCLGLRDAEVQGAVPYSLEDEALEDSELVQYTDCLKANCQACHAVPEKSLKVLRL